MGVVLNLLPFHPITGVQALGVVGGKPVWPVMGGSEDAFPANTPIAEMTVEQQLAYFKHHDRRKADTLSAFEGLTPEEAKALKAKVAEFERGKLSADEQVIAAAREEAAAAAKAAADAEWSAKVHAADLKAAAGAVLSGDQLKSFLAITDPKVFLGDAGQLDEEKVKTHLTNLYPQQQHSQQQQRNWGQGGGNPSTPTGVDQGIAEAKRRGYIKD